MRNVYFVLVIVFFVSLPLAYKRESIAMLLKGYDSDLALERYDSNNDELMISRHYDARQDASRLIQVIVWGCIIVWLTTFVASVGLLLSRSSVVPFIFPVVMAAASAILLFLFVIFPAIIKIPSGPVT